MATRHLIIGAGPAALSALESIREAAPEDEVKLVSMEDCPPYSPASLSYLLSGRISEGHLWIKDENYFKNLRSTLMRGKEVTRVLPGDKIVVFHDGSYEKYDTLLIASGAEPGTPQIDGLGETEVHNFRTLADCRRLLQKLKSNLKVAILGGGIVGMQVAAALLERGCRVSIIEKELGILPVYFNEEAEVYIRDIFLSHKARFFTGKAVQSVKGQDGGIAIALSDGSSLEADILINATGVKSRMSFLEGTGLKTNLGILVNRKMGTGAADIYAAGDVAEAPDFFSGKPKMNAIVPVAVAQGRVAGANMSGGKSEYEGGIPMTAFHFMGNRAFSIGLIGTLDSAGQVWKQKDDVKRRFKKLVFEGDRLVGGMFINDSIDPGIVTFLIKKRVDLAQYKEALFEGTQPLADPWLRSLKLRV